jgi:hypothetical protein
MSIFKLMVRTVILFVCSLVQVIGVLSEGLSRISVKSGRYLSELDDKVRKGSCKKSKVKAQKVIPT